MTATSSQGLALMTEVVYLAASMRAPIVMAVGNRALSGPINIHCDHSDAMLVRDSGCVQLFAENAQQAYDLMLIAPRIAEHPDVLLPVLVCLDGFTISHSAEAVELLRDDVVRRFVGEYVLPHSVLDPRAPVTRGPFAMPDTYFEFRIQQTEALERSLAAFQHVAAEFYEVAQRRYAPVEAYRCDDAERIVVLLGSTAGTIKDVVDELRVEGEHVGLAEITIFRPFPHAALAAAIGGADEVIVLDRADSPGGTPPLHAEVAASLYGSDARLSGHVYGLGGRDFHPEDARALLAHEREGATWLV
jgi:pyruvate ferredoxin oxidoreductase alpha subunit